jgi:hypothetical protein
VSNYVKVSLFEEMVLPKMENLSIPNVESGDDESDDEEGPKHAQKHSKHSSSGSNPLPGDASSLDSPTHPAQAKGTPQPPVANTLPQRLPTTVDTDGGFLLVDGGSGSVTPQPQHFDPMAMSTDRRRLLGGGSGASQRQQSHGRTLSGGSGDPLAASGSLLNRSPATRQRALSPTPPSPKQHASPPPVTMAAAAAAAGGANSSSQLPDAVRQKSDHVKAVLAQKAAELRRAVADGGGASGAAQTPPPAEQQPPLLQNPRSFVQPQWSNSKW